MVASQITDITVNYSNKKMELCGENNEFLINFKNLQKLESSFSDAAINYEFELSDDQEQNLK